jgi:hypothetical protein
MRRTTVAKLSLAVLAPLFAASTASAALLYSETSNGANPPLVNNPPGATNGESRVSQGNTADPANVVVLDNVTAPTYNGGLGGLNITRVIVNERQTAGAPASTLSLYYSSIVTDRTGSSLPVISAPTFVTNASVAGNGGASTINTPVTFGDGINTLFTLTDSQLNFTDGGVTTGAEFYLGFKSSDTGTSQGLRLAQPDTGFENPVEYYEYNTSTNGQAGFTFFSQIDPNNGAGLWITVEGTVVPEPATLGLAAMGGLMLLARRPNKKD